MNRISAALFEEHKYALGQIEQLTPQADHQNWPVFTMAVVKSTGSHVTSEWADDFTSAYADAKDITDGAMIGRVRHCINELSARRFVEAEQGSRTTRCGTS